MTRILLVIVYYLERKELLSCIDTATRSAQGCCLLDILVVANSPLDAHALPAHVRVEQNSENVGFGRGANRGFRSYGSDRHDFILLSNQDIQFRPDSLRRLCEAMAADTAGRVGILSPVQLDADGRIDRKSMKALRPESCDIVQDAISQRPLQAFYVTQFVNAACWLIRPQVLEQVGGFNPLYRHYGEDVDYVARARRAGFEIAVAPYTHVIHTRVFAQRPQGETASYIAFNHIRTTAIDMVRYSGPMDGGIRAALKYIVATVLSGRLGILQGFRLMLELVRLRHRMRDDQLYIQP